MDRVCSTVASRIGDVWAWQQENAKLQQKINELKKTLSYYADKSNYHQIGYIGVRRAILIEKDGGNLARKTLEELKR